VQCGNVLVDGMQRPAQRGTVPCPEHEYLSLHDRLSAGRHLLVFRL
jgi:hypothetical protein